MQIQGQRPIIEFKLQDVMRGGAYLCLEFLKERPETGGQGAEGYIAKLCLKTTHTHTHREKRHLNNKTCDEIMCVLPRHLELAKLQVVK